MTCITIELEERHKRLKPICSPLLKRNTDTVEMDFKKHDLEPKSYAKNYGYFSSTRYATRLTSIAFGIYYRDKIKFEKMYLVYSGITLTIILFLFIYFQELRVILSKIESI